MHKLLAHKFLSLAVWFLCPLVVGCGAPPSPAITEIAPPIACDAMESRTFSIQGSGFLKSDLLPEVTFTKTDNPAVTAKVTATSVSNCMDQNCAALSVSVSAAQLPDGKYNVTVKNNCSDQSCTSTQTGSVAQVEVIAPPTLTDVSPKIMCSGAAMLSLTGSHFISSTTVRIDTANAMSVMTSADGTTATASFAGPLPLSPVDPMSLVRTPFDVTVQTAAGCSAVLPKAVTITPGPAILFVDPPSIPAGYSLQATIFGASIAPPIQSVQIAQAGTTNFSPVKVTPNADHPNQILITLPADLAPSSYDITLNDQTACAATLHNAFQVVATPTLTINAPVPAFGGIGQNTAVTISGSGFQNTPRAYLAVSGGGTGVSSSALRAVTFVSSSSLNAVIPNTLPANNYDLIVVNPDGSFGIASDAFSVTATPPPVITSIAPAGVVQGTDSAITVNGTDLGNGTVSANCFAGSLSTLIGPATIGPATVTGTSIQTTLKAPTGSSFCIVRVTVGQASFDFSAVGVTNSSDNLSAFTNSASALNQSRRALGAIAGRATQTARFVYAIGGDTGSGQTTFGQPTASVEAASIGQDGTLGQFRVLSQPLPKPLSFMGISNIGRFIYVASGFDGAAAVTDTYRAEILDPLQAPQITDVDVIFDTQNGLSSGMYIYRVSALKSGSDPNNPGGETLAGDFFPIQVPQLSDGKLDLVLFFPKVSGAQSYNIYRTVKAGDAAGSELLLKNIPDNGMPVQSAADDGTITPAGASPLPLGSIGAWKTLGALAIPRVGAGVTIAPDPDPAHPGTFYLYALGGNSGTPASAKLLTSVEYMTITQTIVNGIEQQSTTAWTAANQSLPSPTWLLSGLTGTSALNSFIPANQTLIYAASGSSADLNTATTVGNVYVSTLGALGQPGTFTDVTPSPPTTVINSCGFGGILVNNTMFALGGIQGGALPSNKNVKSGLLSGGTKIGNFTALGTGNFATPRALQGTAIESAFIYQIGGEDASFSPLGSILQTVW